METSHLIATVEEMRLWRRVSELVRVSENAMLTQVVLPVATIGAERAEERTFPRMDEGVAL